jgi:hypothetical protein
MLFAMPGLITTTNSTISSIHLPQSGVPFMKKIHFAATALMMLGMSSAYAGGNIGIQLGISGEVAPGVYGNVIIGDRHPNFVYPEPIIIRETREVREPIYLHVPPEHARHWDRYCENYHACDRRVFFVRSSEYRDFRDERYQEHHDHDDHDDHDHH